jgi:hypothetical protein
MFRFYRKTGFCELIVPKYRHSAKKKLDEPGRIHRLIILIRNRNSINKRPLLTQLTPQKGGQVAENNQKILKFNKCKYPDKKNFYFIFNSKTPYNSQLCVIPISEDLRQNLNF